MRREQVVTEEESRLDGRGMKERLWLAVVDYCPFRSAALSASNGNSDKKTYTKRETRTKRFHKFASDRHENKPSSAVWGAEVNL